jgi:hypothetical protein
MRCQITIARYYDSDNDFFYCVNEVITKPITEMNKPNYGKRVGLRSA